jgi:hypothetical protein
MLATAVHSNLFNDFDQLLFHFSEVYLTITLQCSFGFIDVQVGTKVFLFWGSPKLRGNGFDQGSRFLLPVCLTSITEENLICKLLSESGQRYSGRFYSLVECRTKWKQLMI